MISNKQKETKVKIENLEEQIINIDPNNLTENDLSVIEFTIQ